MNNAIIALDNIRFYQRQAVKANLEGNALLRSIQRESIQEWVGHLVKEIEVELAYEERQRYNSLTCTCTPNSDACELCKMSTYYKPDDDVTITPDMELPV